MFWLSARRTIRGCGNCKMADNLTREQRSYCMSRVRNRDTAPEQTVRRTLHKLGYRFRKHERSVPGRPDIVFHAPKIAVFIDGDFWHGYRFPLWRHTVSQFWVEKIEKNRARDQRNFRRLRRAGWRVVRIWEHEIDRDLSNVIARITAHLASDGR